MNERRRTLSDVLNIVLNYGLLLLEIPATVHLSGMPALRPQMGEG
jgi:hypothetical protein